MLLAAICCCALANQQTPARHEAPPGHTLLAIYQAHTVYLNGMAGASPGDIQGKSVRYDRLGVCNWEVLDGGYKGIPCKIYQGDGNWHYNSTIRNTAMRDYHNAKFTMLYYIGDDGIPIHSESHFRDEGDKSLKTIDVVANYKSDHISETYTVNGESEQKDLYPSFGMEKFAGMFEPMMQSGLIQHSQMDCAVLHPYTGAPYEFTLTVRSRFTGEYFFLPQAGYCIDISGPETEGRALLSRQGQLLQVILPNRVDASQEEAPLVDERNGWGTFSISDWDKSTDETNPERPIYHTLAVPVMFKNPKILFPVPCALTD